MKTFKRYLWREIAISCVGTFGILLALFWFFDLMAELGETGHGRYHTAQAMLYVTLQLPSRFYELMPIGALLGGLWALGGLHGTSEYTIIRSSGVSQWGIARALLQGGILLAVLTLICGEWLAPLSMQHANQMKLSATNTLLAREFRSGLWVRQQDSFINVRQVMPDKTLREISVYRFGLDRQLREVMHAREGKPIAQDKWLIKEVSTTVFSAKNATTTTTHQLEWHSGITPTLLSTLLIRPDQMSIRDLYNYIGHLQANKQKSTRYEAALWNKLIYPLVSLLMLALAIPFAAVNRRQGGAGGRLLTGILVGLSFYLLNKVSIYLAQQADTAGPFGALLSPIILITLAVILVWRQERR